jgi:hypothetical protein
MSEFTLWTERRYSTEETLEVDGDWKRFKAYVIQSSANDLPFAPRLVCAEEGVTEDRIIVLHSLTYGKMIAAVLQAWIDECEALHTTPIPHLSDFVQTYFASEPHATTPPQGDPQA